MDEGFAGGKYKYKFWLDERFVVNFFFLFWNLKGGASFHQFTEVYEKLSLSRSREDISEFWWNEGDFLPNKTSNTRGILLPISLTCNVTALRAISRKIANAHRDFVYLINNVHVGK